MDFTPDLSQFILICFSATNDIKGKLVRLFTGNVYNHVSILYKSHFWDKWMSIQIDKNGVQILPVYALLKKDMYNKFYKCDVDLSVGIRKNIEYIGKKYDIFGVFGIGIKILIRKIFGRKIKNLLNVDSRVFCTEYLTMVMQDSGFPGSYEIDSSLSEPGDIIELLCNSNESSEIFVTDLDNFR